MITKTLEIVFAVCITCGVSFAAQTWAGEITTRMCGKSHMDSKCIQNCIKAGEKYVFVSKGKILEIQNQDFADLEKHTGHSVKLTGTLSPSGKMVTVSQIEMSSTR
jgi:hypothetical protein